MNAGSSNSRANELSSFYFSSFCTWIECLSILVLNIQKLTDQLPGIIISFDDQRETNI